MRIGIGIGLFPRKGGTGSPPAPAPTLDLVLTPATPLPGDLVTLSGLVGGTPRPTAFASLAVTIAGTAVPLAGTGLSRTFVARTGTLAITASVTTTEGSASDTAAATVPAGTIVATVAGFGSSTMEGNNASTTAARALNLMAATLGAGTIRNQGLGGTVLQNSFDASAAPRANNGRDRFAVVLLGAAKSDRLYILHGSNDLRYTGAPATFNVTQYAIDLAEVMNGLLTGGYAATEIVIGSPNWYPDVTYSTGSAGFTGSNRTIHEAHVAACAAVAMDYGVAYADVYAAMRDQGGLALTDSDNLHPNDAGHQVIASAFLKAGVPNARAAAVPGAATSPAAGEVSLTWAAVPGATGYVVEAGVAGSHAFPLIASLAGTAHVFAGLAPGQYAARLRPTFADGSGPWRFWPGPVAVGGAGVLRTVTGADVFAGQATGTLIEALAADQGAWVRHPLSTGAAAMDASGAALRGPGVTAQFCVATVDDAALAAAGVFVEIDCLIRSNNAQLTTYAVARASASALTFLAAGYNGAAWRILKYVAGTPTVLGSFAQVESIGAVPVMRLEVETGVQRLYRDDVLLLTTTEPDAGLGAVGNGLGIRIGAGTVAWTSANGAPLTGIRVGRLGA